MMGFYPANGLTLTGQLDQPTRIEAAGGYDAVNGVTMGMRACAHRIYDDFSPVAAGTVFDSSRNVWKSMNSGHIVLWSTGMKGSGTTDPLTWANNIIAGQYDTAWRNMFNAIEKGYDWGGPIDKTLKIPGASFGGVKVQEFWFLLLTEWNINTNGSAAVKSAMAGAMKHIMLLYDGMTFPNGHHIYFAPNLSNPGTYPDTVDGWLDYLGPNDITNRGTRSVDAIAYDFYWPATQVSKTFSKKANETAFSGGGKYNKWAPYKTLTDGSGKTRLPTNAPDLIGEYAIRIPTDGTPPAGSDPGYISTWYAGMRSFIAARPLPNGSASLRIMSQYVAASNIDDRPTGGTDNAILPDLVTGPGPKKQDGTLYNSNWANFQNPGISLRPAWVAYRENLALCGNPSMQPLDPGVVPTGVFADAPADGARTTTLHWTTNIKNQAYIIYRNGVKQGSPLPAGTSSATINAPDGPLPPSPQPVFKVSAVGNDGIETAQSSGVTVAFHALPGVAPATPTGLDVPLALIQPDSAVAEADAPSGVVTGFNWAVDGDLVNFTQSITPTTTLLGLSSDTDHTVQVRAFNDAGASDWSAAVSFHTAAAPDTQEPEIPGQPSLLADPTPLAVVLDWTEVEDIPVPGQVLSGVQNYIVSSGPTDQPSDIDIPVAGRPISPPWTDTAPISSREKATQRFYFISAADAAGNVSDPSPALPVLIPQASIPQNPTAILTQNPVGSLDPNQPATFSLQGSLPGTAGRSVKYTFDFGDGVVISGGAAVVSHSWPTARQWIVQAKVTDEMGNDSPIVELPVIVNPPDGPTFQFLNVPKVVQDSDIKAADVNVPFRAIDAFGANHESRLTQSETQERLVGMPVTARRHGNADAVTATPSNAASVLTLVTNTMYVFRIQMLPGSVFSQVKAVQLATSVSTITGAFTCLFDMYGKLLTPSPATDVSGILALTTGGAAGTPISFDLDGAPYIPPLGDDAITDTTQASFQFFFGLYSGTLGANKPQLACGAATAVVNLGCVDGNPATDLIDLLPLFATAANGPTGSLTPPATTGALTRLPASPALSFV
jgi:hypothetical protein